MYQAPLVDRVLALQSTIGNHAVARIVSTPAAASGRRAPSKRVLARQTGLRTTENVTAFASEAERYWSEARAADSNVRLRDYADHLMNTANEMLTGLGSVECLRSFKPGGHDRGVFDAATWTIEINPAKFGKVPGKTKVRELTLDEAREVADTIFHESRHSEQFFRIARLQAGRLGGLTVKKAAEKIKAAMGIPLDVALAAAKKPLTGEPADPELVEASNWESGTVGFHRKYKAKVNRWRDAAHAAQITEFTNLDAKRRSLDAAVAEWKAGYVEFARGHLVKTSRKTPKSTVDEGVIKNLEAILKAFDALDTATKHVAKEWTTLRGTIIDPDGPKRVRLKALNQKRYALYNALYHAYKTHVHEEDAYAIGAAVQDAFKAAYDAEPPPFDPFAPQAPPLDSPPLDPFAPQAPPLDSPPLDPFAPQAPPLDPPARRKSVLVPVLQGRRRDDAGK